MYPVSKMNKKKLNSQKKKYRNIWEKCKSVTHNNEISEGKKRKNYKLKTIFKTKFL